MRKNYVAIVMATLALTCVSNGAEAQILKKIGKALEQVTKSDTKTASSSTGNKVMKTAVITSNGVQLANPADEWVDIQFVGCYGNKATKVVKVVVKVTAKKDMKMTTLGGPGSDNCKLYDADGNMYESDNSWGRGGLTLVADVPLKWDVAERVKDVPPTVDKFVAIKVPWHVDGSNHSSNLGDVVLKNVPIEWK